MIKNLLYSIFLHLTLLLLIIISFNLHKKEEVEEEINITLEPLIESKKANITPQKIPDEKKIEEKKTEQKKPEPKKVEPKKIEEKKPVEKKAVEKKPEPILTKNSKEVKKPDETKKPILEKDQKEDMSKLLEKIEKEEKPNIKEEKPPIKEEKPLIKEEKPTTKTENQPKPSISEEVASLENINLSPREKLNIQLQLKRCYKKTTSENKPKIKITINIKAKISKEGYITSNLNEIIDQARYNNPKEIDYKNAIDNVSKALNLCSPLRNLPIDKYDIWKEVSLKFDEDSLN
jgi:hypothetical protein